jgi:foldase protein PrsA
MAALRCASGMRTLFGIVLAFGAVFMSACVLSACGSSTGVPGNAVAVVQGQPITKATYDRWALITARGLSSTSQNAVVPDPPSYTNCMAALRKQAQVTAKATKNAIKPPADSELLTQCKANQQRVIQQTMAGLIEAAWVQAEAKKRGITVTNAAIGQQLAVTKKQSFPSAGSYEKFLATSGMTQAEVLERVRVQVLAQRISQKIQPAESPVSEAQIRNYYRLNKAQFSIPERRDVDIILTRSQAQANAAKVMVRGGASWRATAQKYSTEAVSKANGGELKGVVKGQEDKALDAAVFSAKKGILIGPVHGRLGWYVARVLAIAAPQIPTLAQARERVRLLLSHKGEQEQIAGFMLDFQKRWMSVTTCRSGYIVQLCENAPRSKPQKVPPTLISN